MSVPETRLARRYRHRIIPALLVIAIGTFFLFGNLGIDFPLFDYAN